MADERFFTRAGPFTVSQIAEISGAQIHGGADGKRIIEDVAPLDVATASHVSFLDNVRYKNQFKVTKAGACFISPAMVDAAPDGVALLVSDAPYKAYALTAQAFYPQSVPKPHIADTVHIDPSAKIGNGVRIDPFAVIGADAHIGDGTHVQSHALIGEGVKIGQHCRIGASATVSHALIGDYVRLYTGVRIGQDGFGFAIDPTGHVKVPQLGRVVIEDHVEIGANTTIDRGAGPDTVIGQGTWIDNLVQIGHNVKIGRGCIIVSQVGISGSTVIEDFVAIGGQVGIAGHLRIGLGARLAAQSGIMRDVPAGEEQMGYPAVPKKQFMRQIATLNRLIKNKKNA